MILIFAIVTVDDSIELEQSAPMARFHTMNRELVWEWSEVKPSSTIQKIAQAVRYKYGHHSLLRSFGRNTGFISICALRRILKV